MPGFTTHYLFGQQTYQSLQPSSVKQTIQKYHRVFALGLQGPDIFFYDIPSHISMKKNPGSIAHTANTGDFLFHLLESPDIFLTKQEQKIAVAYIFGFIGHYLLDTTCHPYIYAMTHYKEQQKGYLGHHVRLETDIDASLLWFFQHKHPSEFRQDKSIAITREQLDVVSAILHYAFQKTYPALPLSRQDIVRAIRSMQQGTKLLYDPSGYKKAFLRRIESVIPGYPIVSPLVANDTLMFHTDPCNTRHVSWKNPWDEEQESDESFFDLFETAQEEYRQILNCVARLFSCDSAVLRQTQEHSSADLGKEKALSLLKRRLGNRSYHSGLSSTSYLP